MTDRQNSPELPGDIERVVERSAIPWKLGGVILLGVIVLVFVFQNTAAVEMNFLVWDFDLPLIVLVVVCLGSGMLFDRSFRWWRRRRQSEENMKKG